MTNYRPMRKLKQGGKAVDDLAVTCIRLDFNAYLNKLTFFHPILSYSHGLCEKKKKKISKQSKTKQKKVEQNKATKKKKAPLTPRPPLFFF